MTKQACPLEDGGTVAGYFYRAMDARLAFGHLRCTFEDLAVEPSTTHASLGLIWCLRVVVPGHGPYLHRCEAIEQIQETVTRWNGIVGPWRDPLTQSPRQGSPRRHAPGALGESEVGTTAIDSRIGTHVGTDDC